MIPVFTGETPFEIAPDVFAMPFHTPFPMAGVGRLYFQPLVIRGKEPVLVDTGGVRFVEQYLATAFSLVEPADVRWIFLSHEDGDHAGGFVRLLELCPKARIVTSFAGLFKLFEHIDPPKVLERAYLLNPGEALDVGDRQLVAIRPPFYDSPSTRGLFDGRSRVLFTVDGFGATVPRFEPYAEAFDASVLKSGFEFWARFNCPWHELIDESRLRTHCAPLLECAPDAVVSYHGPVYRGLSTLIEQAMAMCRLPASQGVTQREFEEMARRMRSGAGPSS